MPKARPYNRSRRYLIKKLQGVQSDDGQYRIRSVRCQNLLVGLFWFPLTNDGPEQGA
jgi:hypothetical protein